MSAMSDDLYVSNAAVEAHMRTVGTTCPSKCTADAPEVDLHEVLVAKVRAGEPIYIAGPLDGPDGHVHLETISRLRSETGLPVRVIFN